MTVKEFIEWLKTQPQGDTVQVLTSRPKNYEIVTEWRDFEPDEMSWSLGGFITLGNME